MIKALAIIGSATLHVSLLAGLTAAGVDDLPAGRNAAISLVMVVPVATPGDLGPPGDLVAPRDAGSAASPATSPIEPGTLDSEQAHADAAPMADQVQPKTPPDPEPDAPSVPAPMLTPVRAPAPEPTVATARPASADPATTPLVDVAPAAGHDPAAPSAGSSGGANGGAASFTMAALVASVEPAYPVDARRAGQEGRVVVKAFIGAAGTVERTAIEVSSGFAALDTAAATAVSSYRFRPEVRNGTAVASTVLVPIRFSLTDSRQ